ncbi:MAG: PAS domain-containing protein [Deltaproteobacteria bacterium]|nr:PAS domain-containing protein [Deltaproteobacteria bacterium]
MRTKKPPIINIALVGGGTFCREILQKTTAYHGEQDVNARFTAVADPDPESPGMLLARELGLLTVRDYHQLYEPKYGIRMIILMTPENGVFDEILDSRPPRIRVLSYHVFEILWKAIGLEECTLRERTNEIETILNGIQDFIVVINPDKEVVEINNSFLKIMGCTRSELIGRKCYDIFHEMDKNQYEICDKSCPMNEVIRSRRPYHFVIDQKDIHGKPRYLEIAMHPFYEENGKISKFIEIIRDITTRIKEEEEITRQRLEQMVQDRTRHLKETHKKLLYQDKMASIGKLSASVVHEINNPITGILNLTILSQRMIQEESFNKKDMGLFKHYLNLMEKETRRISRIVSNLLAFSRQSQMEAGPVNINNIIDQTLLLNSNLVKLNNVKVNKRIDPSLPETVGSADQLQQVFMNFLTNAVEAMESTNGGTLSISTKRLLKSDRIIIRFTDTGIGIPSENRSSLFEPFFTTKKGKGVGLGLSVAYGIIQEHGGSIDVKSKEGKGTTFEIQLPVKNVRFPSDL